MHRAQQCLATALVMIKMVVVLVVVMDAMVKLVVIMIDVAIIRITQFLQSSLWHCVNSSLVRLLVSPILTRCFLGCFPFSLSRILLYMSVAIKQDRNVHNINASHF